MHDSMMIEHVPADATDKSEGKSGRYDGRDQTMLAGALCISAKGDYPLSAWCGGTARGEHQRRLFSAEQFLESTSVGLKGRVRPSSDLRLLKLEHAGTLAALITITSSHGCSRM